MSVSIAPDRIMLSGAATVEDAEPLLAALLEYPAHDVDVSALTRAHLAVVQLLHAARRPIVGQPEDGALPGMALTALIQIKP